MSTLDDTMKTLVDEGMPYVATVDRDGTPNLGPKMSLRALDDHTLIFGESSQGQTLANVKDGSKVVVAIADLGKQAGYRFIGTPTVHESGPVWQAATEAAEQGGGMVPNTFVTVDVEAVYDIWPGPNLGKKVA